QPRGRRAVHGMGRERPGPGRDRGGRVGGGGGGFKCARAVAGGSVGGGGGCGCGPWGRGRRRGAGGGCGGFRRVLEPGSQPETRFGMPRGVCGPHMPTRWSGDSCVVRNRRGMIVSGSDAMSSTIEELKRLYEECYRLSQEGRH